MKNGKWVMLSGTSLILIAMLLNSIYYSISESNRAEYVLPDVLINPGEHHADTVTLKGENEVSIFIIVEQVGIPIQVTLQTQEGNKVGDFTSDKDHDSKIIENPYPQGNFEVITSNLGNEQANVVVYVSDVKQPGTYIETYDAWWILTYPTAIAFWIGLFTLLIGVAMYFDERRKVIKN